MQMRMREPLVEQYSICWVNHISACRNADLTRVSASAKR